MGTLGDLKAQQLILLAVFVSFVTSIATGITTVSLMESAPQPVQEVVNRIVERTVERVVPADDSPREKEIVTTVVKEEDLMIGSVEKNSTSVVRIQVDTEPYAFASIGLVVDSKKIVADGTQLVVDGVYRVVSPQGTFSARVVDKNDSFAILVPEKSDAPALVAATIADSSGVKLAQSVIAISGSLGNEIASGVVTGLASTTVSTSVSGATIMPGTALVNLRGDVVGLRISDGSAATTFAAASSIKAFVSGAAKVP